MPVQVSEIPVVTTPVAPINIIDPLPKSAPPTLVKEQQIRQDMGLLSGKELTDGAAIDTVAERTAQDWADKLLKCDQTDPLQAKNARSAVDNLGLGVQTKLAKKSAMLKQQISVLAGAAESSAVANALVGLKVHVDELNPHKVNFGEPGFVGRLVQHLPGVGTPLNRYFTKWQSSGAIIDAIVLQLREGADQLVRDIDVLTDDQTEMRQLTIREQRTIQAALLLDQKLSAGIDALTDEERKKFMQEEVLFPLRQRIQDLQQSLLVNQQGVISYEIIIRNNRELVRSAKRCQDVTVRALETAVVIALALNNQRIVLNTIKAIDATAAQLLVQNSIALHQQGVEIHKQASEQSIPIEAMKQSFTELNAAMDDVERFKQEALPLMAQRMREMDVLSGQANKAIEKMEQGNKNRPAIALELEPTGAPNK